MRKFAFLFCLMSFFALTNLYGAEKQENPIDNMTKDQSFIASAYDYVVAFTCSLASNLKRSAYGTISSIFNNGVAYTLIVLIACFWLFKQLKNGIITREELYKAMIWIITFIIVYVLLNSNGAYNEFCSWFSIPANIVKSAFASSIMGGSNVGEILNYTFVKPFMMLFEIVPNVFNYFWDEASFWEVVPAALLGVFISSGVGFFYCIYLIMDFIVVIAIMIMHLYSILLSAIYLAFLPIMIPLLLLPQTRAIFFAWVKAYIAITMYIPLSMIPLSIMNKCSQIIVENSSTVFIHKITFLFVIGILVSVIAIALLSKIPTWIGELLGVQNQGVGIGGALGMLKTAGMAVGGGVSAALPAMAKSIAGSAKNLKSGSGLLSKAGSVANIGNLGEYGAGMGIAKAGLKGGFRAMGNFFKKKSNTNE